MLGSSPKDLQINIIMNTEQYWNLPGNKNSVRSDMSIDRATNVHTELRRSDIKKGMKSATKK